jgi:hypothetical protein
MIKLPEYTCGYKTGSGFSSWEKGRGINEGSGFAYEMGDGFCYIVVQILRRNYPAYLVIREHG